jgi:PadR family transcriptional regulator PadR
MTLNGTDELLAKWEEVYKKGLLSFWMLLVLQRRPAYAFEMNGLIQDLSQGTISADDNSLYRALSRFEDVGLLASELRPSPTGPARRYYALTPTGRDLLRRFIERNVMVFRTPAVEQVMDDLKETNHE